MDVVQNFNKKEDAKDLLIGGAAVGAVVLVGGLLLRRRMNIKTGKMLLLAADTAVSDWVLELEKNGFQVLVLSKSLVEKMTDAGFALAPAA